MKKEYTITMLFQVQGGPAGTWELSGRTMEDKEVSLEKSLCIREQLALRGISHTEDGCDNFMPNQNARAQFQRVDTVLLST